MNKVIMLVEAPESVWTRGLCDVSDKGTLEYEAKFCRAGMSPKPVHMGPAVTLSVRNAAGREIARKSITLGVKSNGDFFLQSYNEAESELEKAGTDKA